VHPAPSASVPRFGAKQALSAEDSTGETGREDAFLLVEGVTFYLGADVDGLFGGAQLVENAAASLAGWRSSDEGVDLESFLQASGPLQSASHVVEDSIDCGRRSFGPLTLGERSG
jgi:hypothetical protein